MPDNNVILYGMQASLYTGKARAFMRRNRISVRERGAGHPDYSGKIMPQIGRFIIPVIEMPNGNIVQDGTDILDYLAEQGLSQEPLYPADPITRAIAHLFELFGNEGLLRPAMHYRWNFDDDNLSFIKLSFQDAFPAHFDAAGRAAMFDHSSGRMRKAGMAFGVMPETFATIEKSYAEFLSLYEAHLTDTYYLLGNAPTIGDYGLFNPLYAHLARDPKPANLMKTTAPRVWNWVERMNRPEQLEEHTVENPPNGLWAGDDLPATLKNLMIYVGEEYGAEFLAHVDFADDWLSKQAGNRDAKPERSMGFANFNWRGHDVKTVVMAYRFYLAQRLWDHFDTCSKEDQSAIQALFTDCGVEVFLEKRPTRRVLRVNHQEVWAD
ncbi:MAG: glutathione S-transferase family protein [Litorimonas sp.]